MKLVVDANRLYSAVLRDGQTRHLFFTTPAQLFAPAALKEEIERHADELAYRSHTNRESIDDFLRLLFSRITWVADDAIQTHLPQAIQAIGPRDSSDAVYVACALAMDAHNIWSHDKDFDVQNLVPRISNEGLSKEPSERSRM